MNAPTWLYVVLVLGQLLLSVKLARDTRHARMAAWRAGQAAERTAAAASQIVHRRN